MDQSKKVDVSSTFIENIFRSGLTLVRSNNIITIKIDKKNKKNVKITRRHTNKKIIQNKNLGCQMDIREKNSDYEMEKR